MKVNPIVLIFGFLFIYISVILSQRKKQFESQIMIKNMPQYLIANIYIKEESNGRLQKLLKNFQLVRLTHIYLIEFRNKESMELSNDIIKLSSLIKLEIVADDSEDFLNGSEILLVKDSQFCQTFNRHNTVDINFLFDFNESKKGYLYKGEENKIMHPWVHLKRTFCKIGASYDHTNLKFHISDHSKAPVKGYLTCEESFLKNNNQPIAFNSAEFLFKKVITYSHTQTQSYDKNKKTTLYLNFSPYANQIRTSTSITLKEFEKTENVNDVWLVKLEKYMKSQVKGSNYHHTLHGKLLCFNVITGVRLKYRGKVKNLFIKIKEKYQIKALYPDLEILRLWKSLRRVRVFENKNSPKIKALFLTALTIFISISILFFLGIKVKSKRRNSKYTVNKKLIKVQVKQTNKPSKKKTNFPKLFKELDKKRRKEFQTFCARVMQSYRTYINYLVEFEEESVNNVDLVLLGDYTMRDFEGVVAINLYIRMRDNKDLEEENKEDGRHKISHNESSWQAVIDMLAGIKVSRSYRLHSLSFNNENFPESMKTLVHLCSCLNYFVTLEKNTYVEKRGIQKASVEFFIETLLQANLDFDDKEYVLRGPGGEVIDLGNLNTALASLEELFEEIGIQPLPFYRKVEYVRQVKLLKDSEEFAMCFERRNVT